MNHNQFTANVRSERDDLIRAANAGEFDKSLFRENQKKYANEINKTGISKVTITENDCLIIR